MNNDHDIIYLLLTRGAILLPLLGLTLGILYGVFIRRQILATFGLTCAGLVGIGIIALFNAGFLASYADDAHAKLMPYEHCMRKPFTTESTEGLEKLRMCRENVYQGHLKIKGAILAHHEKCSNSPKYVYLECDKMKENALREAFLLYNANFNADPEQILKHKKVVAAMVVPEKWVWDNSMNHTLPDHMNPDKWEKK